MNAVDIIVKKRDGHELSADELQFFVDGIVAESIPDYQAAAWAMAVYFQGMTDAETAALTMAMASTGDQLDLHHCLREDSVIVDKHSSGGVGDKTTLAVGSIVAACGLPVGKMSGRGLSHTGGTIDKLESISGWRADLNKAEFCRQLQQVGLVLAAQTADLAPADKILYALRDVTGTVPSLPLIASSIMSKKLAAGADAIVLDVKCGQGAFTRTLAEARRLAQMMVAIGERAGRKVTALLTQMEQPLGCAVGNSVEVREAIDMLRGRGPDDFRELVEAVAVEMLILGAGRAQEASADRAQAEVRQAIVSGAAYEKFVAFVAAQGGDPAQVEHPERLPIASLQHAVVSESAAIVQAIDPQEVGLAAVDLGGGRHKKDDVIDHSVGIVLACKVGDSVQNGDELATIYAADDESAHAAAERVRRAYTLRDEPVESLTVVYERITSTNS
jgi:pyrimidine-nucleoside phosphorylase